MSPSRFRSASRSFATNPNTILRYTSTTAANFITATSNDSNPTSHSLLSLPPLGVSLSILEALASVAGSRSTVHVCQDIIKSRTANFACTYVDWILMKPGGNVEGGKRDKGEEVGRATHYVCHCWADRFVDVVAALRVRIRHPYNRMHDDYLFMFEFVFEFTFSFFLVGSKDFDNLFLREQKEQLPNISQPFHLFLLLCRILFGIAKLEPSSSSWTSFVSTSTHLRYPIPFTR
jgi:hypothetical protein